MQFPLVSLALAFLTGSCIIASSPDSREPAPSRPTAERPAPRPDAKPDPNPRPDPAPRPRPRPAPSSEAFTITLERGPCFGRCPVYSVTVDASGAVTFDGKRFVAAQGTQRARIAPAQVASLRAALDAADVPSLKDCYCERRVTDLPTAVVTVERDGERRRIEHYLGDDSAPEALVALQKAIDEAAGTQRWIEGDGGNGDDVGKPQGEPLEVTIQRTACFGRCPVYEMTIDHTGAVVFEGQRYTAAQGTQRAKISAQAVAELRKAIDRADFFSLKECYCERRITDQPSVIVSVKRGNRARTVRHYTGDRSAPVELIALQKTIDRLGGARQWVEAAEK